MDYQKFIKFWKCVADVVIVIFSYVLVFMFAMTASFLLWLVDHQDFVESLSDVIRNLV